MDNTLTITHTRTADGKPLAVVKNFRGLDAELRPAQLRGMAQALLLAADECEQLATEARRVTLTYHVGRP
jgi:hypothetical protein